MNLFAFTCGWVTGPFRGQELGDIRIPVPCYLVEHPAGKALIDSGLHPEMRTDPHARVDWLADVLGFELPDGEDVVSRLEALDTSPDDLRYLVNTHLHFDHAGGNELIPANVELVVHEREWAAATDADGVEANFFNPSDYSRARPIKTVAGEHDLFGDGTVVTFPTPGHTPGHQSIRVRLDGGEMVICADACYFVDWIDSEETPPYGFNKRIELESLRRLRALRDAGAWMLYGHDPDQWEMVPQAPTPIGELEPVS